MSDFGHVTVWSGVKIGRERQAMTLWADVLEFYEKAKANGLIDDYETQVFQPTGNVLTYGDHHPLGKPRSDRRVLARNDDRRRLQARSLVLDDLVETWAGPAAQRCSRASAHSRRPSTV